MMAANRPKTLAELKESGYQPKSVRQEMRENLIRKLRGGEKLFTGIIGYDETVIPDIQNAILAGHDMIFLGERGQAKSRIIRSLVDLLDEAIPAVESCEIHDDPLAPICLGCRLRAAEEGDNLHIVWIGRNERYGEKLATPDTTIADLIGEIDPIKVAEGKYLSDELTIHFGLIPRTNRGIFAINELPDLAEKVQVGLFNIMEERDVQIKGHRVRLNLDVVIVASANPEDYTSRGRIITPLKDRYNSLMRTHYPLERETEIHIMDQESIKFDKDGINVNVPGFMKELVAETTMLARKSSDINQSSGVSVRVSIANIESLTANAERRAITLDEDEAVPRVSDLNALFATTSGKIELEYAGENITERKVIGKLIRNAVKNVFDHYFKLNALEPVITAFKEGGIYYEAGDDIPNDAAANSAESVTGLMEAVSSLGDFTTQGQIAAAAEFILEGLHINGKIHKEQVKGKTLYQK